MMTSGQRLERLIVRTELPRSGCKPRGRISDTVYSKLHGDISGETETMLGVGGVEMAIQGGGGDSGDWGKCRDPARVRH